MDRVSRAALASLAAIVVVAAGLVAHSRAAARDGLRASSPLASWASLFPPRVENLRRCDTFEAVVDVWAAADLAAFQLEIGYDPAVIEFAAASVAPWLAAQWPAYSELPPVTGNGNVLFAAAADDGSGSASGDGEIARVTFRAVDDGTTVLDLHNVQLIDSVGAVVAVTSTGSVAIVLDEDGEGCVATSTATSTVGATSTSTDSPGGGSPSATNRTPTPTASATATRAPTLATPLPTTPGPSPSATDRSTAPPTHTTSPAPGTAETTPTTGTATVPPGWSLFLPRTQVK